MSEIDLLSVKIEADASEFNSGMNKAVESLTKFGLQINSLNASEMSLNNDLAKNADKFQQQSKRIEETTRKIEEQKKTLELASKAHEENSEQVIKETQKLAKLELQLHNQTSALNKTLRAGEKLSSRLQNVAQEQERLKTEVQKTNDELDKQQNEFTQTAKKGNDLKNVFLTIKELALGYAGKTLFSALVGSNAEFEQSMTSFEVLLGSAKEADKLMGELQDFAGATPLDMEQTVKATQLLLGYGVEAENVIGIMSRLGDLSQGNAEKLGRVSLAYGQMLAKGKVTGEELRQMVEAQVPMLQGLSEYLGKTTAEVQSMISDGAVSINDLNGAIEEMTSSGGKFFGMMDKQSQTMTGLFSTLTDDIQIFGRELGEQTFEALKEELIDVMNAIEKMKQSGQLDDMAENWGRTIARFVTILVNAVEILYKMRSVLLGVGAAWAGFKVLSTVVPMLQLTITSMQALTTATGRSAAKQQLANLVDGKAVLMKNAVTGAITIETAAKAKEMIATDGATYSQLAFNAALLANPYKLVAIALGVLVASIAGFNQHMEMAEQKQQQARQEASNLSDEYKETAKSIDDLTNKYRELATSTDLDLNGKNELKSIQEQLIGLYGLEADGINLVNGRYEEQIQILNNLNKQKAEEYRRENYTNYVNAKKSLYDDKSDGHGVAGEVAAYGNAYKRLEYYDDLIKRIEGSSEKIKQMQDASYQYYLKQYNILKKEIDESENVINSYNQSLLQDEYAEHINDVKQAQLEYNKALKEQDNTKIQEAGENLAGVKDALKKAVAGNEELEKAVDETFKTLSNGSEETKAEMTDAENDIKKISENLGLVQSALNELDENKKLNINTLDTLLSKYPELLAYVNDEKALYNELIKKENQEKNNYISAMQNKLAANDDFANTVLQNNELLVDNLAKAYNVDKSNFQEIATIKQEIDTLLIQVLGENWSQFYGSQADALSGYITSVTNSMNNTAFAITAGVTPEFSSRISSSVSPALSPEALANLEKAKAHLALLKAIRDAAGRASISTANLGRAGNKSKKKTTKKDDAIKDMLTDLDRQYQMGWIAEEEYWKKIIDIRDKYYKKYSDEWWNLTLKIQKHNEDTHKQKVTDVEKNNTQYIKLSNDYIKACEKDGWGTDSEIDAHNRKIEQLKILQEEAINNAEFTAEEIEKIWLDLENEITQTQRSLKDIHKKDLSEKNEQSFTYIEERSYFNDWESVDDDILSAYDRIAQRNRKAVEEGIQSEEEYNKTMAKCGEELYDNKLQNSMDWLTQEREYNDMSVESYLNGLYRVQDYTKEFYENGKISYRKYAEEIQSINNQIFDTQTELYDEFLLSKSNYITELENQFNDLYASMRKSWEVEDRHDDINVTQTKLEEFKGAVTLQGRQEYERLQEQYKQLKREEDMYRLEVDNNAKLEKLRAEYTKLESDKKEYLKNMNSSTAEIKGNMKRIYEFLPNFISGIMDLPSKIGTAITNTITNNYTNAPTVTQNNTINDATAGRAVANTIRTFLLIKR